MQLEDTESSVERAKNWSVAPSIYKGEAHWEDWFSSQSWSLSKMFENMIFFPPPGNN